MVTGTVNSVLEGIVSLPIQHAHGQWHDVDAVVDSAFTRSLTLTPALIRSLGLLRSSRIQLILADGTITWFDVFEATVIWNSRHQTIEVEASDVFPLIGTRMMAGYQLRIDFVVGGAVAIEELP